MFGLYLSRYLLEKQLLSEQDVDDIADMSYPGFVDALVGKNRLTRDDAQKHVKDFMQEQGLSDGCISTLSSGRLEDIVPLFIHFDPSDAVNEHIEAFKVDSELPDEELDKLHEDGELHWVLPGYVQDDPLFYNQYVLMAVENLYRLISKNIVLSKARVVKDYSFKGLASQALKGTHRIFLGIAGNEESLLSISGTFSKREFTEMSKSVFDGLCELVNNINGLFASKHSTDGVYMEIDLPHWYSDKSITSNGWIYCLPIALGGAEIELLISFDSDVEIM